MLIQMLKQVTKRDGSLQDADRAKINKQIDWCTDGLSVDKSKLIKALEGALYNKITTTQINRTATVEAGNLISIDEPQWTYVAARFVLQELLKVVTHGSIVYPTFRAFTELAIQEKRLEPEVVALYDLDLLEAELDYSRDLDFDYLGIQTLADRYFIRDRNKKVIELPQHFWMRVALGLAAAETPENRNAFAIKLYHEFSTTRFLTSTPTLFNSATLFPQLSSCFGATTYDSLDSIMDTLKEHAAYSKFSGGCSTSYSAIRASGSPIASTGGKAKGPVPYAKLYNDLVNAFDQGGKRKGVGSYYIEPWHPDIYEVLKTRDPGGDDRTRTHDTFPALWIPDLFMERVADEAEWSLIDPAVEPRLHETYGAEFETLYLGLEAQGKVVRKVPAAKLYQEILTKWFQQGTFWPCFKDEINHRYLQKDSGIVHHSNLCLTGDTKVTVIRNGNMVEETLEELVRDFKGVKVLSYNTETNTTEFKPVTNGALTARSAQLIRITDQKTGRQIRCTPDHKVWTQNRGYVEARSLVSTDTLYIG